MGCKVKELRFGLHKCRTPESMRSLAHRRLYHDFCKATTILAKSENFSLQKTVFYDTI